ncbi:MAG: hypothetical protein RL477_1094 [Pseudomonadota bacterium]|jgi:GST-like protein
MIELYTWTTGNGRKIVMMLEEVGVPYEVHPVNIRRGDQFRPEFLQISPNNKVPAIVDRDGPGGRPLAVFESAACLMYLAEKTGLLLPADITGRYAAMQWLILSVAGLGPVIGQAHYFHGPGKDGNERAAERFTDETRRVFNVLEKRLGEAPWLGGDDYSIADISTYGRAAGWKAAGLNIDDTPRVKDWLARIEARPASGRAAKVIDDIRAKYDVPLDDAAKELLYGKAQYARR